MKKKISNKDQKDWDNFLNSKDKLFNKDKSGVNKNFSLVRTVDLHGYSLDEANNKIEDLIKDSYKNGINKLIIITGKGLHSQNENNPYVSKDLGILKYSVPEYINSNKELMSLIIEIKEAKIEDGGNGAFYVYLKKKL